MRTRSQASFCPGGRSALDCVDELLSEERKGRYMTVHYEWREVYDYWFPANLADAGLETMVQTCTWWMRTAKPELPRFLPIVTAAREGKLNHWCATPAGRLSLIIVLDQFPRELFVGTPEAYSSDPNALLLAEEGLRLGDYDKLPIGLGERSFFLLPLVHAEGADHLQRLERVLVESKKKLAAAPEHLKKLYEFSVSQVQGQIEVISRFGRFPHRNSVLGRASTPEELAYIEKGEFIHLRPVDVG
jgi:uncharacterized protein (DUF924 family)